MAMLCASKVTLPKHLDKQSYKNNMDTSETNSIIDGNEPSFSSTPKNENTSLNDSIENINNNEQIIEKIDQKSNENLPSFNEVVNNVVAFDDNVIMESKTDNNNIEFNIDKKSISKSNNGDTDVNSMSVFLDGRASIEHQIDIHVLDIVDYQTNKSINLYDVLEGLKYAYDYRIEGGKMQHLDQDLMTRLCEALLINIGHLEGGILKQKLKPESKLAFELFGNFFEEVEEFRIAVGKKSAYDLCHTLHIEKYIKTADENEKKNVISVLGHLSKFPQFDDWKELVVAESRDQIALLIEKYPDSFNHPAMYDSLIIHPPPSLYFDKNCLKLAEMYGTDINLGLTQEKVLQQIEIYGKNILPPPKKRSILLMIWDQLYNFMIIILLAAAIAEFATKDFKAAVVLIIVIVLNTIIGFTQEYKASKAIDALSSLTVAKATVIRDGSRLIINSEELVPGDLVILEEGDAIPADLRLCEVSQLEIIEILLTGEALPVSKSVRTIRQRSRKIPLQDCKGNAFMSTVVARGRGKGIVVRTGIYTEIGKISNAITAQPHRKTNLERKLEYLGRWLVVLAIFLCILIVVIGVAYKNNAEEQVKVGISLAVSVIPEGLVAVVTVTMALGVVRMAKKNAIVRKLPSVETLGSVNMICSDKTGTLTEGKMGTEQIWTSDNEYYKFHESTNMDPKIGAVSKFNPILENEMESNNNENKSINNENINGNEININNIPVKRNINDAYIPPEGSLPKDFKLLPPHLITCLLTASLCNNSSIKYDEDKKSYSSIGDPTEVAMILAAEKSGISREYLKDNIGLEKIGEYAFDSDRKLMSVIFEQKSINTNENYENIGKFDDNTALILIKGAPEGILSNSTHYLTSFNNNNESSSSKIENLTCFNLSKNCIKEVDEDFINLVGETSSNMASKGLRVLALGIRYLKLEEAKNIISSKNEKESESNIVFIGLIGLIDPPKTGVKESVAICRTAGVKVVMMTGDHITTASSIAEKLGILDLNDPVRCRAMKGSEVDALSEEQLAFLDPFPTVFARLSPDNKLKIVKALQEQGNQIAVTGDGVNDAPAIKQADIGIAMGINGTEITKQAADVVLADDNFSTIISAIKEGRGVYDNISKFIIYLLSCNSAEIILFLVSALSNQSMPFTTIQILYANIIADVPPAMALGYEPVEEDIMERPPRPAKSSVLNAGLSVYVIVQGIILSMLSFGIYMMTRRYGFAGFETQRQQESITYMLLTVMQLVQSFYCKSIDKSVFVTGITSNYWLILGNLISLGLLILGIYTPNFNSWLELESVNGYGWIIVLVCVCIQLILVEFTKIFLRMYLKRRELKIKLQREKELYDYSHQININTSSDDNNIDSSDSSDNK